MEKEALIISTNKKLKTDFYIWYGFLIALGIFSFKTNYPFPKLNDSLAINLQQVIILCLLGGIPGVLIYAKNKIKRLVEIPEIERRLDQYKRYVHIRQTVFFVLGFLILFIQVFTMMGSALMLFAVIIFLCLFITPTRSRLEAETGVNLPVNKSMPTADPHNAGFEVESDKDE
ncbi:MAG: hypothetical protein M0P26_07630 [Bacteroidales bacterium]|nr:hypothetical protein [Bacteroidales bacterium]